MNNTGPQPEIRPVTQGDMSLLGEWMQQAHWQEWWGDPDTELGYVQDMLDGKDSTRPFFFLTEGRPAGYVQFWNLGDAQQPPWCDEAPWVFEFSPETIGVDISIGPAELLSTGLGSQVLRHFVGELRQQGYEKIIIDPDKHNSRAIRAYEKAGFAPIERLRDKTDDVLLMHHLAD